MHFYKAAQYEVSQMYLVMYVCSLGKKRKRENEHGTRAGDDESVCPVIKTLLVLPKPRGFTLHSVRPRNRWVWTEELALECGLHRSSFIPSVHRLGRGEKGKSGPGLEERNTTVKERGVEKKDPWFLKSRDKEKDFRRSGFSTDSGENRCCFHANKMVVDDKLLPMKNPVCVS